MKKLLLIFILAFLLNWFWENLHSPLYVHYQGQTITQWILLRSALIDATFITAMAVLFIRAVYFKNRLWFALVFGFVASVPLELYALQTGRWAYGDLMPVIPFLKTGLTPTIQIGLLSFLIFKAVGIKDNR